MWVTQGITVNPVIDALLADTGALSNGGQSQITILLSSTITGQVLFELRDVANTGVVASHALIANAGSTLQFELPGVTWAAGQRFRLRTPAVLTGSVQGSLFFFP